MIFIINFCISIKNDNNKIFILNTKLDIKSYIYKTIYLQYDSYLLLKVLILLSMKININMFLVNKKKHFY